MVSLSAQEVGQAPRIKALAPLLPAEHPKNHRRQEAHQFARRAFTDPGEAGENAAEFRNRSAAQQRAEYAGPLVGQAGALAGDVV
jgi:hypothetical protein